MQFVGLIKCTFKSCSMVIRSQSKLFLLHFVHKVICQQISLFFYLQFPVLEEKGCKLVLSGISSPTVVHTGLT